MARRPRRGEALGLDQHEAVMRHHRAAWRVERVCWVLIALVLAAALLGAFGDGPLSRAQGGSPQTLAVEYDRLLRANAPERYVFATNRVDAGAAELRLRLDRALVDGIELDAILPEPEKQEAGPGYVEFVFAARAGAPMQVDVRYRPTTFGRRSGRVSLAGQHAVAVEQFVYP